LRPQTDDHVAMTRSGDGFHLLHLGDLTRRNLSAV
jgi:hypothetical protein